MYFSSSFECPLDIDEKEIPDCGLVNVDLRAYNQKKLRSHLPQAFVFCSMFERSWVNENILLPLYICICYLSTAQIYLIIYVYPVYGSKRMANINGI